MSVLRFGVSAEGASFRRWFSCNKQKESFARWHIRENKRCLVNELYIVLILQIFIRSFIQIIWIFSPYSFVLRMCFFKFSFANLLRGIIISFVCSNWLPWYFNRLCHSMKRIVLQGTSSSKVYLFINRGFYSVEFVDIDSVLLLLLIEIAQESCIRSCVM